jgi:hypothetical protein
MTGTISMLSLYNAIAMVATASRCRDPRSVVFVVSASFTVVLFDAHQFQ